MDLILRNLRLIEGAAEVETDVAIAEGRIAAIGPGLSAEAEAIDLEGWLAVPGFVESRIHLDKACILERCTSEEGTLAEAIREAAAARLARSGVAVTVLPATDLYLMSAERDHDVVRGVAPAHRLIEAGVNCALSTNNVLNPFTPFGDCSMVRMANLYANIGRIGTRRGLRDCLDMVTGRPAWLMRLEDYGIRTGNPADLVILDCRSAEAAVQRLAPPLMAFKNGRRSFTRQPPQLHRP